MTYSSNMYLLLFNSQYDTCAEKQLQSLSMSIKQGFAMLKKRKNEDRKKKLKGITMSEDLVVLTV